MAFAESMVLGVGLLLCCLASILAVMRLLSPCRRSDRRVALLLTAGAVLLVAVLAAHGVRARRLPVFGRFEVLFSYSLTVVAAYLYVAARYQMRGISAVVVPYATALLALGALSPGRPVVLPPEASSVWLGLHVYTAFVGYALCTLSGILGLAYLVQDGNLKRKRFGALFDRLPALELLDHLMSREIGGAFLMLTLSLAFGAHMVRLRGDGPQWVKDPKIIATVATWAVYAVLMHMRTNADRHGKGMALLTLVGLLFVLFAFLGIHVVADSLHSFVLIGAGLNR